MLAKSGIFHLNRLFVHGCNLKWLCAPVKGFSFSQSFQSLRASDEHRSRDLSSLMPDATTT